MDKGSLILVTGGTGLVGSHLLFELASRGYTIRALKRPGSDIHITRNIFKYLSDDSESLFQKIEWAEGDVLDPVSIQEAMQGVQYVIHSAARISMNPADKVEVMNTNIRGTANMVNASLENNVKKFCQISSVAALGIPLDGKIIDETTEWNRAAEFSAYALSKYLSENEVWRAIQEGLPSLIVNPSVVLGAGNWMRSSGDIFIGARRRYRWYTDGGIGYIDARDVAKCTVDLMESERCNERFILNSENLRYRELMNLIYNNLSQPLPDKKAGKFMLGLGCRLDRWKSRLTGHRHVLTREVAWYATRQLRYSGKKAGEALGYSFRPVQDSIGEIARRFLEFERRNRKE